MSGSGPRDPAVSIVVPTFRRHRYLAKALRSVQRQTWADFEVLVCDNAAESEVRDLVEGLRDERFRYFPRAENVGMLRNALLGFADARGPLLVKLDDDDALEAGFLAALVPPLQADPSLTVAFSDYLLVDGSDEHLLEQTRALAVTKGRAGLPVGTHGPFTSLVTEGTVFLAAAVLRRDAVDWAAVPEAVQTSYDYHLLLQASRAGAGCWYDSRPLVRYRMHPASDGLLNEERQVRGALAALEDALDRREHLEVAPLRRAHAGFSLALGRLLLRRDRASDARVVLLSSLRHRVDLRTLRLLALSGTPAPMRRRVLDARARRSVSSASGVA